MVFAHKKLQILNKRRRRAPKNIYEAVYPLYIVSKWCWLLPYSYNNVTNRYVRKCLLVVLDMVVVIVYTLCFLVVAYQNTLDETQNAISNVSGWFELYSGTMLQIAGWYNCRLVLDICQGVVMNCYYSKRLVKIFNELVSVDTQLSQLGQKLQYTGTYHFVLIGVCIGFIELLVTFPSDYMFFLHDESVLFIFCSYALIPINAMIKMQYLTFVYLIKQQYEFINKRLMEMKDIFETSGPDDGKIMQDISKFVLDEYHLREYITIANNTYYKLFKISVWINRIYGLQVLITFTTTFSIATTQNYLIYDSVTKLEANYSSNQVAEIYFAFQWSFIQVFEVLVCVYYCTVTQSVAKMTGQIVHEFQVKVENKTILAQLKLFSLHILHQNMKFTACQLFSVSKPTLHSILAAVTAYLIIMVQYDLASKSKIMLSANETVSLFKM